MEYNNVGQTYVILERVEGALATSDIVATLKFTVKEIDPSSGEILSFSQTITRTFQKAPLQLYWSLKENWANFLEDGSYLGCLVELKKSLENEGGNQRLCERGQMWFGSWLAHKFERFWELL